ncbi:MAG: glycosyltransferase [Hyphomonadaceae bacterium]|nr:glycosyltransferase [Hyphomonadaceae bacterium]
MTDTLIVMARAPRIGAGKQRLAKEIGRVQAWRINRTLQRRTLKVARDPCWRTLLCITPDGARSSVWARDIPRIDQGGGDLGERLARALAPHRRVAVIGTDAPGITRALLRQAFRALGRHRFAIGPARDGGFWILAARDGREAAQAMAGVRWSSQHALADVLANLPASPAMLAMLRDVDTLADWRALRP